MTTAQATLRGPLYIDLGKRKRGGIDKPDSGLDWRGYNAAPHDGPDKDARGRWKSGHPSVRALGEMPDFAHHFSDDDLRDAKGQAKSLLLAIEAEEKRRKAEAPAKPIPATGAKKPAKPVDPALLAKLEAVRKRPLPRDRAELEAELKGLTVAQLNTLEGAQYSSGKKADKVNSIIDHAVGQLKHEAITHNVGGHRAGSSPEETQRHEQRQAEFLRRKALANERGDREEYAALVAGFGISGTGPGLPPEKPARQKTISEAMFGDEPLMGSHAWRAQQEAKKANPAKPLTVSGSAITKPTTKGHGRITAKDLPAAMAEIDALVANPKSERDRDRAKYILGRMTLPQIKQVADKHNNGLVIGASKDEKVRRLADSIVGTKLDSDAIQGGWQDSAVGTAIASIIANPKTGDAENLAGWLGSLKVSEIDAMAVKHGVKLLGRTKQEKIDSFVDSTVQNKLNSQAIRGGVGDAPAPGSLAAQQAAAKAGPTYLDTPRQIQGDGNFFEGRFHPDGRMGTAWQNLSARQASENIDGQRLDDALAGAIRMGYSGEPGVWAKQKARFEEIISKIKDPQVKANLEYSLKRLKPRPQPPLSAEVRDSAPEPMRKLFDQLGTIPDTGQGGDEAAHLEKIMQRWATGQISPLRLPEEIRRLSGFRHESQEGHHEVRQAVNDAVGAIEAMRRDLKRPTRSFSAEEIRDARAAVQDAKAELVRAYGADPDNWPDTRQDPQVAEYYELARRLAQMQAR